MQLVTIVGGILAFAAAVAAFALFFDAFNWVLGSLAAIAALLSVMWTWHSA